jgi:hypothetical protein
MRKQTADIGIRARAPPVRSERIVASAAELVEFYQFAEKP